MAKSSTQNPLDGPAGGRTDASPAGPGAAEIRAILRRSRGGWETADDESVLRFWRGLTEAERKEIAEKK